MENRKRMNRGIVLLLAAAVPLMLASCTSTEWTENNQTGYQQVQTIQVQGRSFDEVAADIPLSAIIQPEDLVVSPVIDIASLQFLETPTQKVVSSTLEQEKRKNEIVTALNSGEEGIDTSLDESGYGNDPAGGSTATGDVPNTSGELARQATANAFQFIDSGTAYTESIAEYDWLEGRIYEIITSPSGITDFRLKPGEQIAGSPITNDNVNWQFSMGTSVENGESVQHLFIRPLKVGLDTSMIILTNQRTYYFRLASFEDSYMTAVRFRYPIDVGSGYFYEEDFEEYINNAAGGADYAFDISKADYNYVIRAKGKPSWEPVTVFSDQVKTYIQMPLRITTSDELPSVYVERDGEERLVNYRIFGNLYQIDTVITDDQTIVMKSGQNQRVEITRAD